MADSNRDPDAFLSGIEDIAIPIGAMGGVVAGGVLGYVITSERWIEVALFER